MNFILPKHRPAPQENSISDCPDPVTIASTASTEQQQHLLPFDANVAKEYLSNSTALSLPSVTFTPCQCDKIGFGAMLGDPALKTPCASYFDAQIMLNLLTAAASIIVVGLNIGLKGSLLKLSRYERPPTVSSLHARTVSKVFLAQWMNTAVILVMLNNRFMRTLISGEGDYAAYDDTTHAWFKNISTAITLTLAINIFTPHGPDIFKFWFKTKVQMGCLAACCAKSEAALEKLYEPPEWEYAARCGALLNTLFSMLIFAPGVPILVLLAWLNFMMVLFCDKQILLRLCRQPPLYDCAVMANCVRWIPYGMLVHAGIGVWCFGNTEVVPSGRLIEADTITSLAGADDPASLGPIGKWVTRATSWGGVSYFLLFGVVSLYFVLKILNFVFPFGLPGTKGKGKEKSKREGFAEDETTFSEAQAKWEEEGLVTSYQLTDHPDWKALLGGAIKKDVSAPAVAAEKDSQKRSSLVSGSSAERVRSTEASDEDWDSDDSAEEVDDE